MARLIPVALAAALGLASLVFYLDPTIDLTVAQAFYEGQNRFIAQTPVGETLRKLLYWIPTFVLVASVVLWGARRLGWSRWRAPSGRGVLIMLISFALGPGVLVNTILKDHSHRPRPYQTINYGGEDAFRPFYAFDGDCTRNCSFVSGEGAASAWTLGPALLTPPNIRVAAVLAALVYAASAGLLRMAFGGHYLSDTIFAILFTWTVLWLTWVILPRQQAGRWVARDVATGMSKAGARKGKPNSVRTSR